MLEAELSDLSSEEEPTVADAQNAASSQANRQVKSEKGEENDYKLQKTLKPPRATTYTAQALYEQIHSGDVNLEPEYQRDVVWTREKQIGLIDSILRNFYIPPIIFAVNSEDDGSETKTCIDGKQRLTSIYRFMDGLIPHRDPITNERFWYKIDSAVHGGKKTPAARLLPTKYRKAFAGKQIVCVEYTDLTDSDERDIFQRVQLGMALTSAEKLQVIATPRAQFIRSLLNSHVSDKTLGDPNLPWDRSRGSDFRCISQAVFVMSKWTSSPLTGAGTLPQVEKWLTETGESTAKSTKVTKKKRSVGKPSKTRSQTKKGKGKAEDDDMDEDDDDADEEEDQIDDGDYIDAPHVPEVFSKKVRDTYDLFVELTRDSKLRKPFTYQKVSPIEMICIAILIFVHGVHAKPSEKLSPSELSSAISVMRTRVRQEHKDIRMNDRVGKFMIEYIRSIKKTDLPSLASSSNAASASAPVPVASGKRKRQSGAHGGDDDDYGDDGDDAEYGSNSRSSRSRTRAKPSTKRKVDKQPPTTQQPTPAPSVSSGPTGGSGKSKLSAVQDAKNSISTPNPQRLPSPGPSHDRAGSTEVKSEKHSVSPAIPGAGGPSYPSMPFGINPGNIAPGLVEHILGLQMMGFSPIPPQHQPGMGMPMSQMQGVPAMGVNMMMGQPNMAMPNGHGQGQGSMPMSQGGNAGGAGGMRPNSGAGPSAVGMDAPVSMAQMQQWMQGPQGQK